VRVLPISLPAARVHGGTRNLWPVPFTLVIDTHCHLTFPDFAGRTGDVLERAAAHGVTGAITISTNTSDCLEALAIARRFPNVWCSAGVHPLYADFPHAPHVWANLKRVAQDPKCVAWGELGLDNHYTKPERDLQRSVLAEELAFIESCRDEAGGGINKPIVIHCREAFDDLIPILRSTSLDPTRFVFHCFTGTPDDMRKVLDFGAFVSFTGVATYKNASGVRDAAVLVPDGRLMVETDAPFLSPDPHRGTRPCEPWMASLTARNLAELRAQSWDVFHAMINRTTEEFFGIAAG